MEEATYIYALTDPKTEEVRYIGKTLRDLPERYTEHIGAAEQGARGYKYDWIRNLLSKGLEPGLSVLEIVFTPNDWQEREKWWIAFARGLGYRLTNVCDGGEGIRLFGEDNPFYGHKHTIESRHKMSEAQLGHPVSEETRRKIGDIHRGREISKETRYRMSVAHRRENLSLETRLRISEGQKNRGPFSEEMRENIGAGLRDKKKSKEHVHNMSKSYPAFIHRDTGEIIPAGHNLKALCRERGLDPSHLGSVKNGSSGQHKGWILLEEGK